MLIDDTISYLCQVARTKAPAYDYYTLHAYYPELIPILLRLGIVE